MIKKRKRQKVDKDTPLAPHFVFYDYTNPSPAFTEKDVSYIEMPSEYLGDEDLARVRGIEDWVLNTNTGWLNSPAIPGLRPRSTNGHRYVRRYSDDSYERMMDTFLEHIEPKFLPRGLPCNMPGFRVTVPNGDRYYPIMFHDDLEKWVRVLDEAAAFFQTDLAQFDRGKFVVSGGVIHPFSSVEIEPLEEVPPPKDW